MVLPIIDTLIDAVIGRSPVTVTRADGSLIAAGYATGTEETSLGQWLLIDGDDGHRHRVGISASVRVDYGRV